MIRLKKVLLVDDEPEVLQVLSIRMKHWGYQYHTAKNGLSALRLAQKHRPDLIILDIMMPEMDGYTVLSKLKAQKKYQHIPVIILSVAASCAEVERGLSGGAASYVTKPYEAANLLQNIKRALKEA